MNRLAANPIRFIAHSLPPGKAGVQSNPDFAALGRGSIDDPPGLAPVHAIFAPLAAAAASFGLVALPLSAQVQPVDPDSAYNAPIDGDLEQPASTQDAALPPVDSPPARTAPVPTGAATPAVTTAG